MNNLDLEIQTLDEARQMRNLANAIQLADGFSLLFVRCNQRPRQKEIIEELKEKLDGYNIKTIFLDHQIEHLLDELQRQIGDKQYDAIFVYGLESSFPNADEAAESPFVVTLNHARNSFKKVLNCPLVLFLPEYALSAIYHGATDFYSIRSGVYLFSARVEDVELKMSQQASIGYRESLNYSLLERENRIETILRLIDEYESLPEFQRNLRRIYDLKGKLAELYLNSAQYDKGEKLFAEAVKFFRQSEDDVHFLLVSLSGLGALYYEQERYKESEKILQEAVDLSGRLFGTQNSIYAQRLSSLAIVYEAQSKLEEALTLIFESLSITERVSGKLHPDYAGSIGALAGIYHSQGKLEESVTLFNEALNIEEKTLGTDHPSYALLLSNLTKVYHEQGQYQKSLNLAKDAYKIYTRVFGQQHPDTQEIKIVIEVNQAKVREQASRLIPYKN